MYTTDYYRARAILGLMIAGFLTGICTAEIGEKGNSGTGQISPAPAPAPALRDTPSTAAGTIVLDFEDLPPANIGRLPSGYAGLEWDSYEDGDSKWWDWSSESVDPPYSEPHSGDNYLFNAFGRNSLGFSLPNETDRLLGAWFAKTTGNTGTPDLVRFNGYDGDNHLVQQSNWLILSYTPRYLEADFSPVARIEVQHSDSGDASYSMDDLTYETGPAGGAPPAPSEPSPADGAQNISVDVCLEWGDGQPIVLSTAPAPPLDQEQRTQRDIENPTPAPEPLLQAPASPPSEALAETQDTIGSALVTNSSSADGVGDFYSIATNVQLTSIESRLFIPDPMTLRYFVYESSSQTGTYSKIFEKEIPGAGTGQKWYSSGAISVPLTAEKYYFIGVSWQGQASYYYDFSAPNAVSFGAQLSGRHAAYPPGNTTSYAGNHLAYNQRLTTTPVLEPSPATSWDVYFGTNPEELELVATDLDAPTYCPGCLQSWTRYYWKVVARNSYGEKAGPLWYFETVTPVDLNHDGIVDGGDLDLFIEKWLDEVLGP